MIDSDDILEGADFLDHLRLGVRKSRQLAEQLVHDPEVGEEARTLLDRLQALITELELLHLLQPELRRARNDPIWRKPHQLN